MLAGDTRKVVDLIRNMGISAGADRGRLQGVEVMKEDQHTVF
ncbi:MAG: hypothetical protein ACLU4N_08820 [Butyricimonas faecihominis]